VLPEAARRLANSHLCFRHPAELSGMPVCSGFFLGDFLEPVAGIDMVVFMDIFCQLLEYRLSVVVLEIQGDALFVGVEGLIHNISFLSGHYEAGGYFFAVTKTV
jgi:hypothetical protein